MSNVGRYSHLARQIRIESKFFSIEFVEFYAGSVIKLLERSRQGTYELKIGLDSAYWLGNCLLEAVRNVNDKNFFRSRRFNMNQLWMNRFENNKGDFLKVSLVAGKSGVKSIVIPIGINAVGWFECAQMILSIFPSGGKTGLEMDSESARRIKGDTFESKGSEDVSGRRRTGEVTRGASFAECLVYGEWVRAVVCSRMDGWAAWSSIQKALSTFLGFMIQLKPFHDDKTIFFCHDVEEATRIGQLGQCRLEESISVSLQQWSPEVNSAKQRMAFGGGWIAIEGLPFSLWNRNASGTIVEFCGGLIQVDTDTKLFHSLKESRIKVGKMENDFIPASIGIKDGESTIDITIRPLSITPPSATGRTGLSLSRKVEDEVGRGNWTRGSSWGVDNSKFQKRPFSRKPSKQSWKVKRDNRGKVSTELKKDEPTIFQEEDDILCDLKQNQEGDQSIKVLDEINVVGIDFREFNENGSVGGQRQDVQVSDGKKELNREMHVDLGRLGRLLEEKLSGSSGLRGLMDLNQQAHLKEGGLEQFSDLGLKGMYGLKEPNKRQVNQGGFPQKFLLNRPNASDGWVKSKMGHFKPKPIHKFSFSQQIFGSSFDSNPGCDYGGASILKAGDSDSDGEKSTGAEMLGVEVSDDDDKEAQSSLCFNCCSSKFRTFMVEDGVASHRIETEIPLELADETGKDFEINQRSSDEEVDSDNELEGNGAETEAASQNGSIGEEGLNLDLLFDKQNLDPSSSVPGHSPTGVEKREKVGIFSQYERRKKAAFHNANELKSSYQTLRGEEGKGILNSEEGEMRLLLLKKMNLTLSHTVKADQSCQGAKCESERRQGKAEPSVDFEL